RTSQTIAIVALLIAALAVVPRGFLVKYLWLIIALIALIALVLAVLLLRAARRARVDVRPLRAKISRDGEQKRKELEPSGKWSDTFPSSSATRTTTTPGSSRRSRGKPVSTPRGVTDEGRSGSGRRWARITTSSLAAPEKCCRTACGSPSVTPGS